MTAVVEVCDSRQIKPDNENLELLTQKKIQSIQEEYKLDHFRREGMVSWTIDEQNAADYPTKSFIDQLIRRKKEYKYPSELRIKYIARTIKEGNCVGLKDHLYVVNGGVGLEFLLSKQESQQIEHPSGAKIYLHPFSLKYRGWCESHLIPSGEEIKKPDVIRLSHFLVDWNFIKDLYSWEKLNRRE
ncbi:hypothetical protein HY494_00915 [Candidatus Woesearchaeota archaeon]|nr:hypothetical protein [Candidatus Woesearchaeota archaeon]